MENKKNSFTNCGEQLDESSAFCPHCGTKQTIVEETSTIPSEPQNSSMSNSKDKIKNLMREYMKQESTKRNIFNSLLSIIVVFTPIVVFLIMPLKSFSKKIDLEVQITCIYLFILLILYISIFIIVQLLQKKFKVLLIDSYFYKMINGIYGVIFTASLLFFGLSSRHLEYSIQFFKLGLLSIASSNLFFVACESHLSMYKKDV